jgi:hypothetical protein
MNSKTRERPFDEDIPQATLDELREFLEGDVLDAGANPEFKEALRKKLWDLVQAKIGREGPHNG